jgi:radical SAM protein (TIGR01212 family)
MALSDYVNTFGQAMLKRYGERVHKVSLDASFTCPNRDGSKGVGGCTFCNNVSFSPNSKQPAPISHQIAAGRRVIRKRTRAEKYIAYFQAYTNTYDETAALKTLYDMAINEEDVIGLSIGTRPDCVRDDVLDLLVSYQDKGHEIWLELGLQSAFDESLKRVNRGHGFAEYKKTLLAARKRGLQVCTHLIAGLPGESGWHVTESLNRVLDLGVDGLKLHPLHVVKNTILAKEWSDGLYSPMTMQEYINIAADVVERTPSEVIFHRLTGTAAPDILVAPEWCSLKWRVLNGIEDELSARKRQNQQVA